MDFIFICLKYAVVKYEAMNFEIHKAKMNYFEKIMLDVNI